MSRAPKLDPTGAAQRAIDREHLRRCLHLAARARGATSPNPMVGAVIVKDGEVIAEAYHHKAGSAHAEHLALASARVSLEGRALVMPAPGQ